MRALLPAILLAALSLGASAQTPTQQSAPTGGDSAAASQPSLADIAREQRLKKAHSTTRHTLNDESVRHPGQNSDDVGMDSDSGHKAMLAAAAQAGVSPEVYQRAMQQLGVVSRQELQKRADEEARKLGSAQARAAANSEISANESRLAELQHELEPYKKRAQELKTQLDSSHEDAEKRRIAEEARQMASKLMKWAEEAVRLEQRNDVLRKALRQVEAQTPAQQ